MYVYLKCVTRVTILLGCLSDAEPELSVAIRLDQKLHSTTLWLSGIMMRRGMSELRKGRLGEVSAFTRFLVSIEKTRGGRYFVTV